MRIFLLFIAITALSCHQPKPVQPESKSATAVDSSRWQQRVENILPLYGHRNWILVVDKAFPALAATSGMQVINTNADMLTVLKFLDGAIRHAPHITSHVFMDRELSYLPTEKGSAVASFKDSIAQLYHSQPISTILHDSVFTQISAASKNFQVLVLKTNSCIAYSSVYLELDCKYWNAEKEKALRAAMVE